ncbi:MAG: 1-acyl-sn-glycerol-3-phosphate acyltransferase [Pseudomonadales bacterium]|nr:1-acyl-sn-glycerol-3-phosphate acyltransferase [Pseudomonadales bacterium]
MRHFIPDFHPQNVAKSAMLWLYTPYKWLFFLPAMVISTNIAALILIFYCLLGGKKLTKVVPVLWARFNTKVTPASVTVIGRENIDFNQSYVIVANHQSQFDIFAIYGWLGIDLRWVMKQELRNIPVFGYACEVMGQIIIDRSNPKQAMKTIEQAKDKVKDGTSIMFFPEGTRSLDGQLLPFKAGAFKFATELGLPILPVTIRGSHAILPPKTIRLQPGEIDIIVHPPIEVNSLSANHALEPRAQRDFEKKEIARLIRTSRDAISSAL